MDAATQDKLLTLMREGRSRAESTDWFRVGLGLVYLAGLMTKDEIDFKAVDREFNRFIYHTLGNGHTITSVLQFMSGEKVMPTVDSSRFLDAFARHCPGVPAGVGAVPARTEPGRGQEHLGHRTGRPAGRVDRATEGI